MPPIPRSSGLLAAPPAGGAPRWPPHGRPCWLRVPAPPSPRRNHLRAIAGLSAHYPQLLSTSPAVSTNAPGSHGILSTIRRPIDFASITNRNVHINDDYLVIFRIFVTKHALSVTKFRNSS